MICPRCRIDLPGRVTHDTPEECIAALRGRLDRTESELSESRRREDNLANRVDAWKLKAKVAAPRNEGNLSTRLEKAENRAAYSAKKLKELEERIVQAEQRANFAVSQVGFMQQRVGLQRAS